MNIIQCCDCRPIVCGCQNIYKGVAFDSCHFYLTCTDCSQVHQYDKCFKMKECADVCRPYGSICFDSACGCFWALGVGEADRIYKLDRRLREIDRLVVQLPDFCGSITGLDCCDASTLLICGSFGKAAVSKSDGSVVSLIEKASEDLPCCAVASVPSGMVSAFNGRHTHGLIWRSMDPGEETQCWLPDCCKIEDLALCGQEYDGCLRLCVLLTRHCGYSYLMVCRLCVCGELCHEEPRECHGSGEQCHNCQPNSGAHSGGCRGSAEELIRSIALIEAALSHILNAEGEKIQTVIGCCNDLGQIRQVNADAYKMVLGITQLEQVLYAKMQTAMEIWNIDGPPAAAKE